MKKRLMNLILIASLVLLPVIFPCDKVIAETNTFGYTTTPTAAWEYIGENYVVARAHTYTGASGTGISMSIYGYYLSGTAYVEMAVYDSTWHLVAKTVPVYVNSTTPQWWTASFNGTADFTEQEYYLAFNSKGTRFVWKYNTDDVNTKYKSTSYPTWPNPISMTDWGTNKEIIGIYVTYTPTPEIVTPTVTTQAATSVEETTTTGNGNITNSGGENCTARGIWYDTNSGIPYAYSNNESGSFSTGNFTRSLTGLTRGELYYARASAVNSAGIGYGSEVQFLTKPDHSHYWGMWPHDNQYNLAWNVASGTDYYEIRYLPGATAPSTNTSGTLGYWGTALSANITGLLSGTQYSFTKWSHATEGGLWSTSDDNPIFTDTTTGEPPLEDLEPPINFHIYDLGGIKIQCTWEAGNLNDRYALYVYRRDYPVNRVDYEEAYIGSNTTVTLSGFSLETTEYYFSLWGGNATAYSSSYSTFKIGAELSEFQEFIMRLINNVP